MKLGLRTLVNSKQRSIVSSLLRHSQRALLGVLTIMVAGATSLTLVIGHAASAPAGAFTAAFQGNNGFLYTLDSSGSWQNQNLGMMAGTSPSIVPLADGSYEIAFQANTGSLYTLNSNGTPQNWNLGMMSGTSPSIAALPGGGYVVAFQANTGSLYTLSSTSGARNWGLGMWGGTSPSIAILADGSYEVAFQANTGLLYTLNSNSGAQNWGLGMMAGTSPSIAPGLAGAGYEVAFQASNGFLWTLGSAGGGKSQNLGMDGATSPSIALLTDGSYEVAFQSNTNYLYSVNTNGGYQYWGLGMDGSSSPSITALSSGGYQMAFQANSHNLYTTGSAGQASWNLGMWGGSSPSIGNVYVSPPPPPSTVPTASLTGPGSVPVDQSPQLTYASTNVTSCSINGTGLPATNGSVTESAIDTDTTYTLTCSGPGGSASSSTTVTVTPTTDISNIKGNPLDSDATISSTQTRYYYAALQHSSYPSELGETDLSATIGQFAPTVQGMARGNHSLAEIVIEDKSVNNPKAFNDIEFGWTVGAPGKLDGQPHLFVYDSINGQHQPNSHGCYNGCGFISTSSRIKPGSPVAVGAKAKYEIQYTSFGNAWDLYYNGSLIGFYPESVFKQYSGRDFMSGNVQEAYGEVGIDPNAISKDCIFMGNGLNPKYFASAATFSNMNLNLDNQKITEPTAYDLVTTASGFSYGGIGDACSQSTR